MGNYLSLDHELQSKGYLPLNKACDWLKHYHKDASVSYPTALKLVNQNKLRSTKIGNMHRISKVELDRFVVHGNWEEDLELSENLVIAPDTNSNQAIFNRLMDKKEKDDDPYKDLE